MNFHQLNYTPPWFLLWAVPVIFPPFRVRIFPLSLSAVLSITLYVWYTPSKSLPPVASPVLSPPHFLLMLFFVLLLFPYFSSPSFCSFWATFPTYSLPNFSLCFLVFPFFLLHFPQHFSCIIAHCCSRITKFLEVPHFAAPETQIGPSSHTQVSFQFLSLTDRNIAQP